MWPRCWWTSTTHSSRRRHWPMSRSMKRCNSLPHSLTTHLRCDKIFSDSIINYAHFFSFWGCSFIYNIKRKRWNSSIYRVRCCVFESGGSEKAERAFHASQTPGRCCLSARRLGTERPSSSATPRSASGHPAAGTRPHKNTWTQTLSYCTPGCISEDRTRTHPRLQQ